ncbi:ComF family protein [Aeromonas simiae]|uniref:ComF family protein n=1 Tax=Aeromonas simiae TaxID=218936 RepID=UPI0009FDCAB5|nr:ComF family protein [Aeromonas simiae]
MVKGWLAKARGLLGEPHDWCGDCLLCRQSSEEALLCSYCRMALRQEGRHCHGCAAPLPELVPLDRLLCGRCQRRPPPWQRLQVIGDYRAPWPVLVSRFKYSRQWQLAPVLAQLLSDHLDLGDPPEVLIPVPMHWWRRLQRGFNQAEELAREVGRCTGIPVDGSLLRRIRHTPQQSRLSAGTRRRNLRGAFAVRSHHYQHVALLDDVVTTGATAGQLARLLLNSGVARVEVWALCRTQRHPT